MRTQFQIRYDEEGGYDTILDDYDEYRHEGMDPTRALCLAMDQTYGTVWLLKRRGKCEEEPYFSFFNDLAEREKVRNFNDMEQLQAAANVAAGQGKPQTLAWLYKLRYNYASQEDVNARALEEGVRTAFQNIVVVVISKFYSQLEAKQKKVNGNGSARGRVKLGAKQMNFAVEALVELFAEAQAEFEQQESVKQIEG